MRISGSGRGLRMRRTSWVVATGVLAVVLVTACAPVDGPDPEPRARETESASPTPTESSEAPDDGGTPPIEVPLAGPDTTGVSDGVALELADIRTVEENGTILEGVHVPGDLTIEADGVTLRNVRIDGKLQVRGNDITVEDTEVGTMSISASVGMVVRRTEVFGSLGNDGIHVTSARSTVRDLLIEDSWIHSPQVTDESHYDGIQVRGVDGLTLRSNTIDLGEHDPSYTAAVFLEEANGGIANVLIEGNLLNGGGYTLYLSGTGVTVRDNLFGGDAGYGPLYPDTEPTNLIAEGNFWLDGEPIDLTG